MEIDWSNWHTGISEVYAKFDPQHGYYEGINPHVHHNQLVSIHGDSLVKEEREFNRKYEEEYLTGFTPNLDAVQFILENHASTFYVFSSNSKSTVQKGLCQLGIFDRIQTIISRDDVVFVKPNPEGFMHIKNFLGNEKQFLMIGDSGADRDAARAAGIDFLECTTFEKYHEED